MPSSSMLWAAYAKWLGIYSVYHKNCWFLFTKIWKFVYYRWLKHDDWKYPLKWPIANLRFNCTHIRINLLPITKSKLHRPFLSNQKALFKHCQTFETGLSDHHKLISTIMKSGIFKGPPKKKIYRSYKKFDHECFSNALREELETLEGDTYGEVEKNLLMF